jgi:hypothetical protein
LQYTYRLHSGRISYTTFAGIVPYHHTFENETAGRLL